MGTLQRKFLILLVIILLIAGLYASEDTYPEPTNCESHADCLQGKASCILKECHCNEELTIGDGKYKCEDAGVTRCDDSFCKNKKFWNSYCLAKPAGNKVCKCKLHYIGGAKYGKCVSSVGRHPINWFQTACLSRKNCDKHAKCYKGYCSCLYEYTGDGHDCYYERIPCTSRRDCRAIEAGCEKGFCYCDGMFIGNGHYCRKARECPSEGVTCPKNTKCMIETNELLPRTPQCYCDPGFGKSKAGKCESYCSHNAHCKKTYSVCKNRLCACKDELILGEESCEHAPPHPCKTDNDCHAEAKCIYGECSCQGTYVGNGKFCRVTAPCELSSDGITTYTLMENNCGDHSICRVDPYRYKHPTCKCEPGYYKNTDGNCVECTRDIQCNKRYAVCFLSGTCGCKDELVLSETSCVAAPPHTCQADADCDSRARCEQGKCICQGNYIGNGKYCRVSLPCPMNYDCGPSNGTCLRDPLMPDNEPVCRCDKDSAKNKHGKCVECVSDSDCDTTYSTCVNEICKCKDELIKEKKTCKRAPLHPCKTDADCDRKADCIQGKCYCGKTASGHITYNQDWKRSRVKYTGNGKFCRETLACPGQYSCDEQEACIVDPLFPNDRECKCREGTAKISVDGKCEEVTECLKRGNKCWGLSSCKLVRNTYTCVCHTGYEMKAVLLGNQMLVRCLDVDECMMAARPCPFNAVCINSAGSYTCKCNEGYRNNAVNQFLCDDVDECSEKLHSCVGNQGCQNLPGSYTCSCRKGYVWSAGGCILPGRDVSTQVCHCRDNWECKDGKCDCKEGNSICTLCNAHWVGTSADECQRTTECPQSWSEWAPKVAPKQNSCCLLCCC